MDVFGRRRGSQEHNRQSLTLGGVRDKLLSIDRVMGSKSVVSNVGGPASKFFPTLISIGDRLEVG